MDTVETTAGLLEEILDTVHPLMAEGFYLASVPEWYTHDLFAAMRNRDDGRDQGLIDRLQRYSFVTTLADGEGGPVYAVRPEHRAVLQRQWIQSDPQAYLAAHQRALAYWEANPDPNPFAQAQNRLYHLFFVDREVAVAYLVGLFRTYQNERQLAAIKRLLDTADEARSYLALLESEPLDQLGYLLTYLRARLGQLRGAWDESLQELDTLRQQADLLPALTPYVLRAYGHALVDAGKFVEAIEQYRAALALFDKQAAGEGDSDTIQSERAHTMIALGDAHVGLAVAARGYGERRYVEPAGRVGVRAFLTFLSALPLVVYLSFYLGRGVWRPRFWPVLRHFDWIIARLFTTGADQYKRADPLLERHGVPAEAVVADEKLAYLYLMLGDGRQAQSLFTRLLAEEEAPLGEYRQASVRVGLGEAHLLLQQAAEALTPLRTALPVAERYEDEMLAARACALLAEALCRSGEQEEALQQFARSLRGYQQEERWVWATGIGERLDAIRVQPKWPAALQGQAGAISDSLSRRQYPVRFRHPALTLFRRLFLLALPVVLLMVPLLTVVVDAGIEVVPVIQFRAAPLLDPTQTVTSSLSQGVTAANAVQTTNTDAILWLAIVLSGSYLALSLLLGVAVIALTPLRTVQTRGRAAAVHLDEEGVRVGEKGDAPGVDAQTISWEEVARFVKADARLVDEYMFDGSSFALESPQERLVIGSDASWYRSLRRRIGQRLPASARVLNLDYRMWPSWPGILYLLNLLLIGLVFLLAALAPDSLWVDLAATPYSLGELYPYLYLGLVLIPLWWAVIRPLQIRLNLKPDTSLPWWVLGAGLLLAVLQAATFFRPLLTGVNLYPPLITVILLAAGGWAIWRSGGAAGNVYSVWTRGLVAIAVVAVSLLMLSLLWRDVRAYHYLVVGNHWRDRALESADPEQTDDWLTRAVAAYDRAARIGIAEVLGVDGRRAGPVPLGIPEPESFSWVSALLSKAALQAELGRYDEAISTYNDAFPYTNQQDQVYAWRALIRQSWGTEPTAEGAVDAEAGQYALALRDLDQAIELNPDQAAYYLWRGVALQALDRTTAAYDDYERALAVTAADGGQPLAASGRAEAFTGQGWIRYANEAYDDAQPLFEKATEANPRSAEAHLGLGYAHYTLGQYDAALSAWEEAAELAPQDPIIWISLATLHWKLGGLAEAETASCAQYRQSVDLLTQSLDMPGQEQEEIAFTYRTRGQVQYLLRNCPADDALAQYEAALESAIDSYTKALALDAENAGYYQMRGRLAYALWFRLPDTPARDRLLYEALPDLNEADEREPDNSVTDQFRGAVLNALAPRAMERGETDLAAGRYEEALSEFTLVAENQPENVRAAFQAGLAALASGERELAERWYRSALEAAAEDENNVQLLTEALADLDDLLAEQPGLEAASLRRELASTLEAFRSQDPDTAFAQGLAALQEGRQQEAAEFYRRGLDLSVEQASFNAAAAALLELRAQAASYPITPTLSVFKTEFPQLERAAADQSLVEAAFKLGLIATALDAPSEAAEWYNKAVRRTTVEGDYPSLLASRGDLMELWASTGVTLDDLLVHMERQLPDQMVEHPDLEENGLYWRYRAWFRYHLGLAAFRLGAEAAAEEALRLAQVDAERAEEVEPGAHTFVHTYLPEAAWAWYHLARGDDHTDAEEFAAALADYEAAAALINPVANDTAREEAALAAFRAALTSARLGDIEQAAEWYEEGVRRATQYEKQELLDDARADLEALVAAEPDLLDQDDVETLLEILEEGGEV